MGGSQEPVRNDDAACSTSNDVPAMLLMHLNFLCNLQSYYYFISCGIHIASS